MATLREYEENLRNGKYSDPFTTGSRVEDIRGMMNHFQDPRIQRFLQKRLDAALAAENPQYIGNQYINSVPGPEIAQYLGNPVDYQNYFATNQADYTTDPEVQRYLAAQGVYDNIPVQTVTQQNVNPLTVKENPQQKDYTQQTENTQQKEFTFVPTGSKDIAVAKDPVPVYNPVGQEFTSSEDIAAIKDPVPVYNPALQGSTYESPAPDVIPANIVLKSYDDGGSFGFIPKAKAAKDIDWMKVNDYLNRIGEPQNFTDEELAHACYLGTTIPVGRETAPKRLQLMGLAEEARRRNSDRDVKRMKQGIKQKQSEYDKNYSKKAEDLKQSRKGSGQTATWGRY